MAAALAHCSLSVLFVWAENAKLQASDLTLEVAWTFADDPYRVDCYDVRFAWPSLPAGRLEAAKRVIEACTIHATLQHPPRITIEGTVATPGAAAPKRRLRSHWHWLLHPPRVCRHRCARAT